jgi:eukaryotic-like serine/threonine-protein kinase
MMSDDIERWAAVKDLVNQAMELDRDQRAAWLSQHTAPDDVRLEALALVGAEAHTTDFLESSVLAQRGAAAAIHDATRHSADDGVREGDSFGAYQIIRRLGEGGMATVFLATRADEAFRRLVAIKLVRADAVSDFLVERLRQERRLLATLDHPNIARLIDGGTTARGVPYVVMEYVDGEPFDRYCNTHDLSVRQRLKLIRQVAEAVQHAHRNLVVHRDIKAGNILVTKDGIPKLLDFGIAKALADRSRTATGFSAMTPESASPEQLKNQPVTVATDVYALGSLLYHALTGRTPFAGASSSVALLHAICEIDPLPPSRAATAAGIPRDVDLITLKALKKDPNERYDSAATFGADIGRYLDGRPVEAAADSVGYRARRFVTRHPFAIAAAAVALVAAIASVSAIVWQARIAERERGRAERRFTEVRRLANTVIFGLHDAIVRLPGSTPVRKMLVENALQYLNSLANEATDDVPLQRELAEAYERLASVQGGSGNANLGDEAAARESLVKARALRESILRGPGAAPTDIIALASVLQTMAQLSPTTPERLALTRLGLQLLNTLPEGSREDADSVRATLHWNEATAQVDVKDYPAARAAYTQSVVIFERLLAKAEPARRQNASRSLSIVCKNLGALLWVMNDRDAAIAYYQKARELDEARLATQPNNTTWRLDLSFSFASLGHAEMESGRLTSAAGFYTKSLDLRQLAAVADPQNAQAQEAVLRALQSLATVFSRMGDSTRTRDVASRAIALAAARFDAQPDQRRLDQLISALWSDVWTRRALADGGNKSQASALRADACRTLSRIADLQGRGPKIGGNTPAPGSDTATLDRELAACRAAH